MIEIWKPVVGYEGLYMVSNCGRVKSFTRIGKGKILKIIDANPYGHVDLCKDGERHSEKIHRLVAEAFLGPANGRKVQYRDGIKGNNHVSNLYYITSQEYVEEKYRNDLYPTGERNGNHKLTTAQVIEIKFRLAKGQCPAVLLAKMFKVHPTTIWRIKRGERWKHLSKVSQS